jgi:phosphoenolpyruvate synthase/pyruvate phosphate dikinase
MIADMQIIPLKKAQTEDHVGGKAASLGTLLRAGFTVPDGFVVTDLETSEPGSKAVLQAFDSLGAKFVAVRSSALNEDGNQAAWAGQLDTFLNVRRATLLASIQKCMQSIHSARAQAYAAQKNMASGSVAVIVQAMIASEISGVAFSAHPVTGSQEQMVVEAALGLGEAIVSGQVTPDTFVIEAASGNISEQHISTQTKQLVRSAGGQTQWQQLTPPTDQPKLSPTQLLELASTVRRIADLYGKPMDIEWAYAGGALYILQARPITAL